MGKSFLFVVVLSFSCLTAWSQSGTTSTSGTTGTTNTTSGASANMGSVSFDMTGFPQWSKDLRRGEIVAFGSFPFAFFFVNMVYDTYRCATHNWDTRYAPWPVKSAGAVALTQDEQLATLGLAAGTAIVVAIVDHLIVRHKRNKLEEEIRNLPPGTPIINRRPLDAEGSGGKDAALADETAASENASGEDSPPAAGAAAITDDPR